MLPGNVSEFIRKEGTDLYEEVSNNPSLAFRRKTLSTLGDRPRLFFSSQPKGLEFQNTLLDDVGGLGAFVNYDSFMPLCKKAGTRGNQLAPFLLPGPSKHLITAKACDNSRSVEEQVKLSALQATVDLVV